MTIDSRLHFGQPLTVVVLALLNVAFIAGLILYRHGTPCPIHRCFSYPIILRSASLPSTTIRVLRARMAVGRTT